MRPGSIVFAGSLLALVMVAPLAAAQGAPPAPEDLQAEPGGGMGTITLSWLPVPAETGVIHYRVYRQSTQGPVLLGQVPVEAIGEDGRLQFVVDASTDGVVVGLTEIAMLPEAHAFNVSAVAEVGRVRIEGPPSAGASSSPFLACSFPVCVGTHPLTRLGLLRPVDPNFSTVLAEPTVVVEAGRLRVDAAGTYVEQLILVPRAGGFPDPALLDQPALGLSYIPGGPALELAFEAGVDPDPRAEAPVASLWAGRLWVYSNLDKVTDLPVVVVVPGDGEYHGPGQGTPGMEAVAAVVALLGAALVARRR